MSTFSPLVQVFVLDVGTGNLYEVPFISLSLIDELNNGKSATLTLDYASVKAICVSYGITIQDLFTATFREVYVTYGGTKIWDGVISEYNRSKDASGTYTMSIAAVDYFALFQKRRTGLAEVDFIAADPATIPWQLISTSQAMTSGNLGITLGVTASTGLTVTVAYKNAEIRTEIMNLSNAKVQGSFDFDIDLTRKFNVYYPAKGSVRSNIVLDDNNILADTVKIPLLLSMTNSVFSTGQGVNNDNAAVNRQASAPIIASYTLLEDVISDPNAYDFSVLNALGDRYLAYNKLPLYQISLKHDGDDPNITTYSVGDTLIVNIPEEGVNYQPYRVKKRTINIDQASQLIVQLDMLII